VDLDTKPLVPCPQVTYYTFVTKLLWGSPRRQPKAHKPPRHTCHSSRYPYSRLNEKLGPPPSPHAYSSCPHHPETAGKCCETPGPGSSDYMAQRRNLCHLTGMKISFPFAYKRTPEEERWLATQLTKCTVVKGGAGLCCRTRILHSTNVAEAAIPALGTGKTEKAQTWEVLLVNRWIGSDFWESYKESWITVVSFMMVALILWRSRCSAEEKYNRSRLRSKVEEHVTVFIYFYL
jgi:hypothetical protein